MYKYDGYDKQIVKERVAQFRDQTERYFDGTLEADEFLPLRLQNGLYVQRLAPMLRVAIPYGMLSSTQLRKLADISRQFDKGYVHFTTRQNVQFNWPEMKEVPEILEELRSVEMHSIQTSGNCIRNTTTDQFAGAINNEVTDPRPYCEVIRQWSTFHPEFAFLPRKFKIAVNATPDADRAATMVHDIGLEIVRNEQGEVGFKVFVGGGLGRTPVIASEIRSFLPEAHLLSYLDAILRIYNMHGRRDNKYKARIKILVKALGVEEFTRQVEAEWQDIKDGPGTLTTEEVDRVSTYFTDPDYEQLTPNNAELDSFKAENIVFANWMQRNVKPHRVPGYAIVVLSLKKTDVAPGDVSAEQMDAVADLADRFSFGELRITHKQNLVLADVKQSDLITLWKIAAVNGMASPNIGLLTDVITCPGAEFCTLANVRSIPLAQKISERFESIDFQHDIGEIELNISGCMNACGHNPVGNIGITGVEKKNHDEWYQVAVGGSKGNHSAIGKIIGPSFTFNQVPEVIDRLLQVYLRERIEAERFIDTVRRIGVQPFKDYVYATEIEAEPEEENNKHEFKPAQYSVPFYSPRF